LGVADGCSGGLMRPDCAVAATAQATIMSRANFIVKRNTDQKGQSCTDSDYID
jgi:hypothetical protein